MRVLFWADLFWPYVGGIQVWSARLLPALMHRGHEIAVLTAHGQLELPDVDAYKGVAVHRFPLWTVPGDGGMDRLVELHRRVRDLVGRFEPDLLHVNATGPAAYFCLGAAEVCRAPLLVSYHHPMPRLTGTADTVVGRLLSPADWVNWFAGVVGDEICRMFPAVVPRSTVIPMGMDPPTLAPAPLPMSPPRLLCLGRLAREKGFDVALEAFGAIASRHPGVRLVFASNGSTRAGLEAQATRLGVLDRVDFLGGVPFDEVPRLLNESTLVLMPS